MIPIVTAIDERFYPGLKALYNSYKANAGDGFDFYCIVDGDANLFSRIESLGVKAIRSIKWTDDYPVSTWWPEKVPSLFAPLQIPLLFPDHEKAIWIDADCIIVDSLAELGATNFTEPVAACRPNNAAYVLGHMLLGCPAGLEGRAGLFGGLQVFNIKEWNRQKITQQCAKAMQHETITFKWGDQSVLSYVLAGNFCELSMKWQTFAHRLNANIQTARILHWLGDVPWEKNVRNKEQWNKYA